MNSDEARAVMIKETRREILKALNTLYHIMSPSFVVIGAAVSHLELPDDECLKRDLMYLCEKKYVRWTNERRMQPWNERRYKLTAKGNEIANAILTDPALEP